MDRSAATSYLADKGGLTPEGNTITVNSLSDVANGADGLCTLREAITAANNNVASGAAVGECAAGSSADTINVAVSGTINIATALPDITSDMAIHGPGSAQLTISRNSGSLFRILNITGGTVALSGLTITNGQTPDSGEASKGAGIRNVGNLTMDNVVVSSNHAGVASSGGGAGGGGINNQGTLTLTNCSIIGNDTHGGPQAWNGGGIANTGTLTMTNCLVDGNKSGDSSAALGGGGGGIYNTGQMSVNTTAITNNATGNGTIGGPGAGVYTTGSLPASLSYCTVSHNFTGAVPNSNQGFGGGIYTQSNLVIIGSTISNNNSAGFQGAIFNQSTLTLIDSTVSSNNNAIGINSSETGARLILTNCTITANFGNGVYGSNTPTPIRNTIVAGNGDSDVVGSYSSQGHNLIGMPFSNGVPGLTNGVNGDQVGSQNAPLDPHLGPLANNGGPTLTHALLSNSTALDAGDNCVADVAHCGDANIPQLTSDQRSRGFSRIADGPDADATATVDIGAYETQALLANVPDTSTNEDTRLIVSFDVGDPSTITSITATSSNAGLVPNDTVHLSGALMGSTGVVTINPAADASGTANITITVNRTGGPESKTFVLTVNSANDAPSFTAGADQNINEDAGAQTVNWATAISPGPSDESSQTVTFQVTNNTNASLFAVAPAISPSGTLTYTPAANANGSATITVVLQDNGGTANGGADTSASQTFTITITAVNDAPSFTKGADQTVNEDSGAQTVTNWATGLSAGPANESSQTLAFQVTNNTNASLFSAGPAVNLSGTLTYTPAPNANGSATISVVIKDNGGTANGGVDTSAVQTFTITVNAVNDAPSFTKGSNPTVNEDSGPQTVNNWATSISAGGGADEAGQTLTFQILGNGNPSIFSSAPAVSANGTLTFTPAANANGSSVITIALKDNGGTLNGGVDTSVSQTFTIFVTPVNDAPSFTKGADQTVNNNAGTQTVSNWATNITAGPGDESAQTLTFQVTGNSNSALFATAPAISSSGTLTYRPAVNQGGTATITLNLKDNGGIAFGGIDTSPSQTFTITVTPVGGFVSFESSSSNTTENSGSTTVNVVRTGDTSKAVTVNYATNADSGLPCSTANGVASPKCDFTAAFGTLNFAVGETSKPITILISQDSFVEGPEAITLTLSSPTGNAALNTPSSMSVTIADDATEAPTNIIDDANMFVRMHYHDFLNREADQSGLNFWTGQMTNCGASDLTVCRVNVSGAFFLSIEFQQTGYLVERIYKVGYGDATATSSLGGSHQVFVPVVRANEFLTDTQRIGRGVIVLQPGWEQVLENNKQAYALEFVQTSRFISALPTTMTPTQFVDKLNLNAGNVLSPSERTTAINLFGIAADTTNVGARAQVLRQIAEDQDLYNAEFNRAFVLTEFFGYLRRNPNDLPDSDYTGYEFWLTKLNQFNGDYIGAEMVKAFIASSEYRQRFGP